MITRFWTNAAGLAGILGLMAAPCILAQTIPANAMSTAKASYGKRTPDGQPDLQGIWSNASLTPLERPAELASKEAFSEEEAAAFARERVASNKEYDDEKAKAARLTNTKLNPEARMGSYNDIFFERAGELARTKRTSLIVDPADGRIPPLTPEAQQRAAVAAKLAKERCGSAEPCINGPEDLNLSTRCMFWPTEGPPMLPSAYNNNYQIFQTKDYVAIAIEMIHSVRIIPLDGRGHLPSNVRPWLGDSRGHWEGDTLVVETTNFSGRQNFRNSTPAMRVTERFTRVGADTLMYRFTVDDPKTFTKPWAAEIPMVATAGPVYEFACHESNYAMTGILAGARLKDGGK